MIFPFPLGFPLRSRKNSLFPSDECFFCEKTLVPSLNALRSVARVSLPPLKRFLDHFNVRFTAKSACSALLRSHNSPSGLRQLDLQPFRFTKNGEPKFFNLPPGNPGSDRFRNAIPLTLDGYPTFPANFVREQPCHPKSQETLDPRPLEMGGSDAYNISKHLLSFVPRYEKAEKT